MTTHQIIYYQKPTESQIGPQRTVETILAKNKTEATKIGRQRAQIRQWRFMGVNTTGDTERLGSSQYTIYIN